MKLLKNNNGQAVAEYLLILTIVVIGAIAAAVFFSGQINEKMKSVGFEIRNMKNDKPI